MIVIGKNNKAYIVLIIVFILIISVGCESQDNLSLKVLKSFKKPFLVSDINIESFIDKDQTYEKLEELIESLDYESIYNKNKKLTMKEMEEDINQYFNALKNSYAGYLANGGDDKFLKAKENILISIEEDMKAEDFQRLLEKNLSFVNDAHFILGDLDYRKFNDENSWFIAENLDLRKTKDGYFSLLDNSFIENRKELELFIRPSIEEKKESKDKDIAERKTIYKVIVFGNSEKEIPRTLKLTNGKQRIIKYKKIKSNAYYSEEPIYKEIKGVKYLKFSDVYMPEEKDKVKVILNAAKEMKKSPISILDLRKNNGGNGFLADKWIETYSGVGGLRSFDGVGIVHKPEEMTEYNKLSGMEYYDENHVIINSTKKTIKNKNLLIVLTDNYMISASESLVDGLHHLENTLFIGMPTSGCISNTLLFSGPLNNSKIIFGFGEYQHIFNKNYFQEFRGFEPDIWMEEIDINELVDFFNKIS